MMFFREPNLPRSIFSHFLVYNKYFCYYKQILFKAYLYSWNSFISLRKKTLIYGAGDAGVQLVESLKKLYLFNQLHL